MRFSNELKVGLGLIAAALIFFLGTRYFEDIPFFGGQYELETAFGDVGGLLQGNAVLINGVKVGSVEAIRLDVAENRVRVRFSVNSDVRIPQGSTTAIEGLAALGNVNLGVNLGPSGNPPLEPGAFVPSDEAGGALDAMLDRAPGLVGRVDTLLLNAGGAFTEVNALLADPSSDLRLTLAALRNATTSLDRLVRAEQARLGRVLTNLEATTGDLRAFTADNRDSLALAVQNLNQVLRRVDRDLAAIEGTAASLDTLLAKVNDGDGSIARALNDSTLYLRLDSTMRNLNQLLNDFQQNPKRYLRELKLIDIF